MYEAYITRIKNLRKHTNADRLLVGECFGNFVIVGLDTKEEELGVYFPTDGRLGVEYATTNNLLRKNDENGINIGGYLDPEKRNIRSIKLRGEKSDGLFMPVESLEKFCDISTLKEGDTITTLNGVLICEKYTPREKKHNPQMSVNKKPKNKILYPMFEEHIDTAQLVYNMNQFKEGDTCYITLKMHGTSQRTANTIKEFTKKPNIFSRLFHIEIKPKKSWDIISGTRRTVLKNFNNGFYGNDNFRKTRHDYFADKLKKGEEIFYEVVGYTENSQLIMPECDNKKTQDKEFIKQYGNRTKFTYGCSEGQNDIFVYRMTMTNEDGFVVEYPTELVKLRCEQMGVKFVPVLDKFIYTTKEDLMERVNKFIEGADPIGKTHVREGVVVRIDNRPKFTAYKHKNWYFKVIEGIIKDAGVLDIEEAESITDENKIEEVRCE